MKYGYARVSTNDQSLDRQLLEMDGYGVQKNNIYLEKQSGKDFDRPVYQRLKRKLGKGDTLYISSLDRLGRNYTGIIKEWQKLREKQVDIVVLDMPLLNTTEYEGLLGELISNIVLQLLAYVAQHNREEILERQAQGIAAAKIRGVQFGRPRSEPNELFEEVIALWERGELSSREAAERCGLGYQTFLTRMREYGKVMILKK